MRTAAAILALILPGFATAQIMAPQKQAALTGMLPKLASAEFDAVLRSPEVLWYTDQEMPAAFQHAIGNGYVDTTFHSAHHNFSGDADELTIRDTAGELGGGNANREFPWNVAPGGAHKAPDVGSFKGLLLPVVNGQRLPVVYFRQDLPERGNSETVVRGGLPLPLGQRNGFNRGWGWTFPVGAILIEALTMRCPDGYDRVFSVRFRIRESNDWGVDMFRPFATHAQLLAALEALPGDNAQRTAAIKEMREPAEIRFLRLADLRHRKRLAFDVTAGISPLPDLTTDDVLSLLDRPFVSGLGEAWRGQAINPANTSGKFNLIPPGHLAPFVGNERVACMNCHETVNQHATMFEQPRGWYGRVRGSDGIFSFHPIDPASVSTNGFARRVVIRRELLESGIVAAYDEQRHPRNLYHRIEGLK